LLLYALHGFVAIGEQFSGYFDGAGAVRTSADKVISSLSSFVNERIVPQSKEATAPPPPPAPIRSPPTQAPSPPSATPSAAPATASASPATAPSYPANARAPPAPPPAAPAPPSAAPAGPPVSSPRRDAKSGPPSKSAENCGAAREDRYPCARRSAPFENDHPRAFEDAITERMRRNSRTAGPCIRGIGGCYWGGGQY
jgi:hypothetical protein